jgi:hypothetical protein
MGLGAALAELARAFQAGGVPMLALKGPALAQALYRDTALRVSRDLDILVAPEDLDRAESVLSAAGYRGEGENRFLTPGQSRLFRRVHHHREYRHPATRVRLELHWRLSRLDSGIFGGPDFDRLWHRREQVLVEGVGVFVPGQRDLLLYLCVHGAFHGWSVLQWLLDVRALLGPEPGPAARALVGEAGERGLLDIAAQTFLLLDSLTGSELSRSLPQGRGTPRARTLASMALGFLVSGKGFGEVAPVSSSMVRIIAYTGLLLNTPARRIRYLLGLLLPTELEIRKFSIPDRLGFLYYLLHPAVTVYRAAVTAAGREDPLYPRSPEEV